jgi:hypothetical protein
MITDFHRLVQSASNAPQLHTRAATNQPEQAIQATTLQQRL